MQHRTRTAGLVTAALAVTGLSVSVPSSAQAAAPSDHTLRWGVSQYLNEHLTSQSFSDGATESASGIVTFVSGRSERATDGSTTTTYTGTARYAFNNPSTGAEVYSITVSDPEIVIDSNAEGQVIGDVSWAVPSQSVAGSVEDAVLTTFGTTSASIVDNVLSATPRWAGVAKADAYGTGKPVDGKSWSPSFVTALPSSLNPFFYASGSTNDAKKAPASVVADLTPTVQVTTTASSPAAGLSLRVDGQRFTPVTNAGDAGVYVGLAPSGGLPDVSSQAGMSSFAASGWVQPSQFTDGAFATRITAEASKLDSARSYSVYTWQAHSHSNTTQDTETPVSIDWSTLASPSTSTPSGAVSATGTNNPAAQSAAGAPIATKLRTTWKSRATRTSLGKLKLTLVSSSTATASGKVKAVVKKSETTTKLKAARLKPNGTTTLTVPKLAPGTWKIVLTYPGADGVASTKKKVSLTV